MVDSLQQWVADGEYGYYAQQTTRTRGFIGDADGTILRKTDNGNVQNLYYAGDKAIGSVGGTASSPVADFDFNFAPVSDSYPAVSPGNYTVVAGDTLRGIAYKAWGDGKLWYLIADANGLMTDGDMHVGQALKIPNRISNLHNDYQTNKVYNAAEIIGDITPTLPDPPPPPQSSGGGDGGCGGFGSVLVMVIAIVATIVTQGAAAELLASAFPTYELVGSVASTIAAESAAIGAAVGNLAGQVAGNLMGVQKGIDFGQIASAGQSAGLGSVFSSAVGAEALTGVGITSPDLQTAVSYGARSILNQGINLLTGQQQSFDWRQVATAAISAPLANLALSGMQGADLGSRMLQSAAGDVVRQSVSSMFYSGGRVNFAAIAGNAFGMAFGNADSLRSFENASQQTAKLSDALDAADAADAFNGAAMEAMAANGAFAGRGLQAAGGFGVRPSQETYQSFAMGWQGRAIDLADQVAADATASGRPRNASDDAREADMAAIRRDAALQAAAKRAYWDQIQVGGWNNLTTQVARGPASATVRITAGDADLSAFATSGVGSEFGGAVSGAATGYSYAQLNSSLANGKQSVLDFIADRRLGSALYVAAEVVVPDSVVGAVLTVAGPVIGKAGQIAVRGANTLPLLGADVGAFAGRKEKRARFELNFA